MSSESKTYRKNFLTMFSGNTIGQIIPFVLAPFLTRIFSPEEFAVLANYLAIVTMIGIVSCGRLEMAVTLPKEDSNARKVVKSGAIILIGLLLLSFLFPIFSESVGIWYGDEDLASHLWKVPLGVLSVGLLLLANNWLLRNKNSISSL